LAKAQKMPADIGVGTGDQGERDGVPVHGHVRQDRGHIGDVAQHDGVGDEAGAFELLLLLDGIAALDHRTPERDPIEKVVVGLDFGGFGTDDASDGSVARFGSRRRSGKI